MRSLPGGDELSSRVAKTITRWKGEERGDVWELEPAMTHPDETSQSIPKVCRPSEFGTSRVAYH